MHKFTLFLAILVIPAVISCSSSKQNAANKIDVNKVPTEAGFVSGKTVKVILL